MAQPQLIAQLNTIALAIKDQLNNVLRVKSIRATGDVDFSGASSFKVPVIAFSAYRSSTITGIPIGSYAKFPFNVEEFDIGGCFSTSTSTFVAPISGIYSIESAIGVDNVGSVAMMLYINGSSYTRLNWQLGDNSAALVVSGSITVKLSAGDSAYIGLYVPDGSDATGGRDWNHFSGHLVVAI